MRVALYGPTGSGKSSVAEELRVKFGFTVLSTGDFVRREFPNDPLNGGFSDREKQIREYVERGVRASTSVVLDGFPRHLDQLLWLQDTFTDPPFVHLFLSVSASEGERRVLRRGRSDSTRFDEQYAAQVDAARVMFEHAQLSDLPYIVPYERALPSAVAVEAVLEGRRLLASLSSIGGIQ